MPSAAPWNPRAAPSGPGSWSRKGNLAARRDQANLWPTSIRWREKPPPSPGPILRSPWWRRTQPSTRWAVGAWPSWRRTVSRGRCDQFIRHWMVILFSRFRRVSARRLTFRGWRYWVEQRQTVLRAPLREASGAPKVWVSIRAGESAMAGHLSTDNKRREGTGG